MNREKMLSNLMTNVWLFSNVFWKYADKIAYNQRKEKAKLVLDKVYWYTDIWTVLPESIDLDNVERNLKILQNFYEPATEAEWSPKH